MSIKLLLRTAQLRDLDAILGLGKEIVVLISEKLSAIPQPSLNPNNLKEIISELLPDDSGTSEIIVRQMLSLSSLHRERSLTVDEVFEGLWYGINNAKDKWPNNKIKQWKSLESHLKELFFNPLVVNISKALDLSYDYANLFQSAKIITDIRPVFDEEASSVEGVVVSHTLRINYDTDEGDKSLSVAVDINDIGLLIKSCERALVKAKTTKKFIQEGTGKGAFICGED